jgi:hypothetical protein
MRFPWRRYWRLAGILFVVALVLSLIVAAIYGSGRLALETVAIAIVDSAVLAVVAAFPLTQSVYRGPRR